jgi:peptidoglycan/LPS O-acetylase OafA/YrhL/lysophospholipase L1-like esterase
MTSSISSQITPAVSGISGFRLDVLGIRGLAVLLVVVHHLNIPGFQAGYIGVDIFFVISGYLIIGLMFKEYLQNGKSLGGYGWISISSFYRRRARRILPAAIFVMAIIYLTSLFTQDDSFKSQTRQDSIWALLFASNINFSQRQTDYFAGTELSSPLLHYWSLAVEEQFYLLMPFLFMAIVNWHGFTLVGRRMSARPRLILVLAFLSMLSLISMIILSLNNSVSLYFETLPRIWEFTVGGIAAVSKPVASHQSKLFLLLLRRSSYFALLLSLILISSTSSAVMLVLPVFATAIILYSNRQLQFGLFFEKVFTNSVMIFFGRISFSLYLWHWPILTYYKYFGLELTWIASLGLFVAIVGISAATERFIERPFLRVGYVSDFHLPQIVKSRRAMLGTFLFLTGGLFFVTYQPLISTYVSEITAQRQQAFWTPPQETASKIPKSQSTPPQVLPSDVPTPKKPIYLGIFGDSTNQCCSASGAFWPRLLARNFNWQFADYSKPATTFISSGVGNNACTRSQDCPSVEGQLTQAEKMSFDVISISSGVGDCSMARSNPESLQKSIRKILQDFRRAYPAAIIFTTAITYPDIESRSDCNSRMNSIISSASEASDVIFLNIARVISDPKVQMTKDGSHLNDSGHALMSKNVIDQLRKEPELARLLKR